MINNKITVSVKDIPEVKEQLEKAQQELEKYKNIVDELEKYLNIKKETNKRFKEVIPIVLNKLKELKGE